MREQPTLQAGETVSLASLTQEALNPKFTDALFLQYRGLFVELCARWISSNNDCAAKISAFGRIVAFSPQLAAHATQFLETATDVPFLGRGSPNSLDFELKEEDVRDILLGLFRLLSFDTSVFARHIRSLELQGLLHHSSRDVRYLATKVLCLYLHAADHATQEMVKSYVGEGEVLAEWEGRVIDYRFLSLWEEKRYSELQSRLHQEQDQSGKLLQTCILEHLSPMTINVRGTLLPRLLGPPSKDAPFDVINTRTTESNLRRIADVLLGSQPLLLTGLAGAGKTLLARHFAWQLNKLESMVTLHLNEQSDAKLLVGMYATGATPGTFSWKAGVLTTAVKEGRWIFVEDLDRAPNEVISTLLPLIERGELLVPSRGETVRAAPGFRIIATMRSTLNQYGQEIVPRQNMIGYRFWKSVPVDMPTLEEFQDVISAKYHVLKPHVDGIVRVYARLLSLYSDPQFSAENGTSLRALTPRDLLKWSDRIATLLENSAAFNAALTDDIFMEALDCFAASLRSEDSRRRVMACVAEELHIDPQRRDHLLLARQIKFDVPSKGGASGYIQVGRAKLQRQKAAKKSNSRPFSANDYTLRLLEKIAVAVHHREPLLLVGETGTGKTTSIQYVAEQLGRKLVAFNLSQQSESGDLLGGYKPVNVRSLVIPLKDEFDELFDSTFSLKKNQRFLEMLGKRVAKGEWKRVCILWREALKMVDAARKAHESRTSSPDPEGGQPKKKRKVDSLPPNFPKARWEKFAADLSALEANLASGSEAFAFSFLEGNIVKAVRNGDWVLLDEINLASPDTLEALADLLGGGPDGTPSILLTETGNVERVVAHPNFRVFAAMNPATDVGKKDLPPGIRSRFTELYVESPDSDPKSLRNIVEKYLGGESGDPAITRAASDVTNLYLEIQRLAKSNMLVDGAEQKAHFSLRTLTRTLTYAREMAPLCSLRRALYEGFHMSFLTFLGRSSEDLVAPLIKKFLFPQKAVLKSELGKPLRRPEDAREYVQQGHYWLRRGQYQVEEQPHYIITPFVQRNMNNLIRACSTRRYPVLIQGPTSSGKTSMIEYLAKRSGNKFVRINNHEHTDLQEYLGSYISGPDGKLQFQEGILVRALREGHWIVLDELNLAPTDVLEALNRLLDDNRELLIPETQEVVRPHEDFMLFATQNPAGLYGGRKVLSRAFRNRFLELHFDDIPVEELTEILHRRTMIPESWCKKIVKVYEELSALRQQERIFEQKSFATLRDLFRWALRKAETIQDLAANGYMLLAERVRNEDGRKAVKNIIEMVMSKSGPKVRIDEDGLFSDALSPELKACFTNPQATASVVWTRAMRRLFVLIANAVRNNEPVLLVGETGCGKTTVCQLLADTMGKELHIVNAHQNTETGDLIGAQRPIRNRASIEEQLRQRIVSVLESFDPNVRLLDLPRLLKLYDELPRDARGTISLEEQEQIRLDRNKAAALFEWADGSLVHAMKTGQFFLLDEISLADDSVLERLNSVLESQRTILLAEKGPVDSLVTASDGFQFLATMNPGGDYGKKELSPALRNRFTEIWVPALSDVDDIMQIVQSKLKPEYTQFAGALVSFAQWFNEKYNTSVASSISIRDTLAWVTFINNSPNPDPVFSIVHGASMVYIDTLGANPAGLLAISPDTIDTERRACLHRLTKLLGIETTSMYFGAIDVVSSPDHLHLGPFSIQKLSNAAEDPSFSLEAPTTRSNAMRVVRALQLSKPILLEGNPGVGKTTLVTAIARAVGQPLTRLNLSEQTDLMDLFGSDIPVEGASAGIFAWRDAPFLKAMKKGDWVLLDEMNLASQSVLEGLNAVLDHRGEVYISELDQTFQKHPAFRVFAAQNPHHQGGGRKGLPASFVNRFTVVYADVFRPEDLTLICTKIFNAVETNEINRLISFVSELDKEVVLRRSFGVQGSPWEFNLRDTLRWLQLVTSSKTGNARDFLDTVFLQRFRTEADRNRLLSLFAQMYGQVPRKTLYHNLSTKTFQVGLGLLSRDSSATQPSIRSIVQVSQLGALESLMIAVEHSWPMILVGPPGSGKTSLINTLAAFTGAKIASFPMNADIDAMDLVGGYEQHDSSRDVQRFFVQLEDFLRRRLACHEDFSSLTHYLKLLEILTNDYTELNEEMYSLLREISKHESADSEASRLMKQLEHLMTAPQTIDGARFQWVDGLLVEALQQGKWLVLDNANLCSSSVLDRLNSLLEPNGYLAINEHSTADGEARIVKPHPDFRIFLTMDPRYGELSRAMRNRAVEICLLPHEDNVSDMSLPSYPMDSSIYRFRHFMRASGTESHHQLCITFEHLSPRDSEMMHSFQLESVKGLLGDSQSQPLQNPAEIQPLTREVSQPDISRFADFYHSNWGTKCLEVAHSLSKFFSFTMEFEMTWPFYPLVNDIFLDHMNPAYHILVKYATMHDQLFALYEMANAVGKIPSMRFERRKEKAKIEPFLRSVCRILRAWAESIPGHHGDTHESARTFKQIRELFWALLRLASGDGFDRATFQTYLSMLNNSLVQYDERSDERAKQLIDALTTELAVFSSETRLTSGLSMERVWQRFKPLTPKSVDEFESILALERLADRVDGAMWKSSLPIAEMARIRERFASALTLVRSGQVEGKELVTNLEGAVHELEQGVAEEDTTITPFFESEFEGLCEFLDVHSGNDISDSLKVLRAYTLVFARRATKSLATQPGSTVSQVFDRLHDYLGMSSPSGQQQALSGSFHASLLHKFNRIDEVQLLQLEEFETELSTLGQHMSLETSNLVRNQYEALHTLCAALVNELLAAHGDCVSSTAPLEISNFAAVSEPLRKALMETLGACLRDIKAPNVVDPETASRAWISFALAGISLYVPNYPFDPALRPMIQRSFFNEEKARVNTKLAALRQFQQRFTGQDSSFRIRQTVEELESMGNEPPVPAILRPSVSELDVLQGELSNLLSIVQPLSNGRLSVEEAACDHTLRQNISHVIKRLVDGYRYYDDITGPVVGFLLSLNIGLAMAAQKMTAESCLNGPISYLTSHTPLLGSSVTTERSPANSLVQNCFDVLEDKHPVIDLRWHVLQCLAIIVRVDRNKLGNESRDFLHNIFAEFYNDWKERLTEDQQKEAAKSSLYTYRGQEDSDTEEADPSLFPNYEKEVTAEEDSNLSTPRDDAIQLADMHEEIFLEGKPAAASIKRLMKWSAENMGRLSEGGQVETTLENTLPVIFLVLKDHSDAMLTSATKEQSYDFYFDANIAEAKHFISLIHQIQRRYRNIQSVWPEHATLGEVLRTCDEALAFRHVEPVAKFITKAEKLHGYMHEWQKVASREFSTASLYDDLTKLLVSWRQLELTTWSKLFDIESKKCQDSTKSWFFVAYELIIAAPESIEEEKAMKDYAIEMLKSLENFFTSTSLGQYKRRIRLLRQFQNHVAMRMQDVNSLKPIHLALENFIVYYSRLEKPVEEALAKGRLALEKEVRDVIKLASWKDINIEALKQSAKTSHRKLSKLVRKFRALLNRPVSGIVGQGFPELKEEPKTAVLEKVNVVPDSSAVEISEGHLQAWRDRPTRFKNVAATLRIMHSKAVPGSETIDGALYLNDFISDLEATMVELQKATPSVLTEENKEAVQHLKTRKRKLFADTLKQLRQMGISSNLSSNVLAKQYDLSIVLSGLPTVSAACGTQTSEAEYFLHKTLHIMPQARNIFKEHSGDLTSSDVSRSIGFLEGLLHCSIRQRGVLGRATDGLQALRATVTKVRNLWTESGELRVMQSDYLEAQSGLYSRVSWLSPLLEVAADIVAAQAKLGQMDCHAATEKLRNWSAESANILEPCPLPANIGTVSQNRADVLWESRLIEIRHGIDSIMVQNPLLRPTLMQLLPWFASKGNLLEGGAEGQSSISIHDLREPLSGLLDGILGSMQDVESAISTLPSSHEDASWLLNEEQALSSAITSLRAGLTCQKLNRLLSNIHRVEYETPQLALKLAAALFASVLPIIEQYLASLSYLIDRFNNLHAATTKLLYRLSKSFLKIGKDGFCTPSEKSDEQRGKDDKLEAGTGLGDGEGAEDISKDVQDDEDLDDLAQEKGEREGSIEEEDDAVDMGDGELEGEEHDVEEKDGEDGSDEEEGDDAESQVGSVDDLGPSAVDEKMWDDGLQEDQEGKEKEGEPDVGTENKEEQVAASDKEKKEQQDKGEPEGSEKQRDEESDIEMEPEDQDENVAMGDTEQMDPHAKEEETLDLPEELNLDGDKDDQSDRDEDMGDMDDMDEEGMEEVEQEECGQPDTVESEIGEDETTENPNDTTDYTKEEEPEEDAEQDQDMDMEPEDPVALPEDQPSEHKQQPDQDVTDNMADIGAGVEATDNAHQDEKNETSENAAKREDGSTGETSEQQQETAAENGTLGQSMDPNAAGRGQDEPESRETEPFKKLGDTLEQWFNQQKQIQDASKKDETQMQQIDKEVDMANADFEHLPDDETQNATQALGTATEDQARTLDQEMGMPVDEDQQAPIRPEDNAEPEENGDADVLMDDAEEEAVGNQEQEAEGDGRPQAFIGEQNPQPRDEDQEMQDAIAQDEMSDEDSVVDVEAQLSLTHLDTETVLPTPETARALWLHHEASTHSLSQTLTEHLRLILAPTMATKLRGDFRTGKRLNLKRIIPYIASGYKRDKIWLRRSQPSKRAYQIMIALDDSQSMANSGASNLALKTIALITRSLSMLEVGEVSVVGFGDTVTVAHDFDKPFTSESGVEVFSKFGFQAQKTNVKDLVERTLDLFAEARRRGGTGQEDLWQLMIVVSDGICDNHAEIQRLVRRAQEERVMIVFVIIDTAVVSSNNNNNSSQPPATNGAPKNQDTTSILDLQSVEFTAEGKLVRWRYMDRFPFRYYLVVRDVRELPGVLSAALRQWFAEVVESGA